MPHYTIIVFTQRNLSLSEIQKRHNGRLLVVLGIALQDLVDLLVILGGEIEGSIDIVVGRIIVLQIVPIDTHGSYLLSAAHVAETHRGLLDQVVLSSPYHGSKLRCGRNTSRCSGKSAEHSRS